MAITDAWKENLQQQCRMPQVAAATAADCRTYNLNVDVFLRRLHGCEMCQLSKRFGLRPFQIIDDTIGSFFL